VLGRDRHRLAETERIGFQHARLGGTAFALVGHQDRGLAGAPHDIRERLVDRRRTRPGVNQKEHRIGGGERGLGLRLHAAGEAVGRGGLQAGGINHREVEIAEPRRAFAAVAGDAGQVIDQRQALADQPVE
jgi:hypothetical protein